MPLGDHCRECGEKRVKGGVFAISLQLCTSFYLSMSLCMSALMCVCVCMCMHTVHERVCVCVCVCVTTQHTATLPSRPESCAAKEEISDFEREEVSVLQGETVAPLGQSSAGQHHRVMDLLDQLVHQLLRVELLSSNFKLLPFTFFLGNCKSGK